MNKKKTIVLTSIIIGVLFIFSIIACVIVFNINKDKKSNHLKVVIYQYYTLSENKHLDPVIYDSFEFDLDTVYSKDIYMLEDNSEFNHVEIKNGKVIVTEANCYNGNCKRMIIDLNSSEFSLLNPNITTIECKPHGLKITLEEIK